MTSELPTITTRPTIIFQSNFNAEKAATKLHRCLKGIGTDARVIIDLLTNHTNQQRQEMKHKYNNMYGRSLTEDLKMELGGHFEDVSLSLLQPLPEFLADCLYLAGKGPKTDEKCLIQILCSTSKTRVYDNNSLATLYLPYPLPTTHFTDQKYSSGRSTIYENKDIQFFFKEKYKNDLETYLRKILNNDLAQLLCSLMVCAQHKSTTDHQETAEKNAQKIYDARRNEERFDEKVLIKLLNGQNVTQLKLLFKAYERISGKNLAEDIQTKFNGPLDAALATMVACVEDTTKHFTEELYNCMQGSGTNDKTLIRILVSRSEVDLKDIKELYLIQYGSNLADDVAADTSGDYRDLLLRIIEP
ncbi:annexin-B12-like [Tachypleus tridentatus]|uniref:annexin-B12-like n=1 Tax=Tachypleus tridentatus TaxID=6853 RepID=UPI003FD5D40D